MILYQRTVPQLESNMTSLPRVLIVMQFINDIKLVLDFFPFAFSFRIIQVNFNASYRKYDEIILVFFAGVALFAFFCFQRHLCDHINMSSIIMDRFMIMTTCFYFFFFFFTIVIIVIFLVRITSEESCWWGKKGFCCKETKKDVYMLLILKRTFCDDTLGNC